jgi:hypothetical protein
MGAPFPARAAGAQARAINPHNNFISVLLRFSNYSGRR